MSNTAEILFDYLSNIFYFKAQDPLDIEKLDHDYQDLGAGLAYLEESLKSCNNYALALSRGDLEAELPPVSNEIAAALKSLHASLRHVTWQSQQVARGDYSQRVDFMGEFADAFNTMVDQLEERREQLEQEIEHSKKHAESMERGQVLLSNLMQNIPHQILVISITNQEVLFQNEEATAELINDPDYVGKLLKLYPEYSGNEQKNDIEIKIKHKDNERYFLISSYPIEWGQEAAVALSLSDITTEKKQIQNLETHAYHDALTGLYNRHFGMVTLNEWLDNKESLALCFIDLDSLKYINDKHGHEEGDRYITIVAEYLTHRKDDSVVCRLGGDEFMILMPGIDFDEAKKRVDEISEMISNDEYTLDKDYNYSISFGIVAVDADNTLPASSVLGMADERMYEHKRARKIKRGESGK